MKTLLLALLLYLTSTSAAFATSEFSTDIESQYRFDSAGAASISHRIDLTNNLSHIYPTTYNLGISSGAIDNIQVTVQDISVAPEIDQQPSTTTIHIPINHPSIGKDQTTSLEISYQTASFAEKIGNTYALTLPKTARGNEAKSFVRHVIVPDTYPELSFSSLSPQQATSSAEYREYRFVGSGDQNLTLHFGTTASYDLNLTYLLKNTTSTTATSELALPPDTAYQQVILNSLTPEPEEIIVDADGNWLARYLLDPLSKLEVKAALIITVSPYPQFFDPSSSKPLGEDVYWEQSSGIKRLATNLKNPENLYNYLVENLTYDYSQITRQKRLGADPTLSNPNSAICTEFTDLFVATSRAMGIPSRAIIGYAVTTNNALRPQGSSVDILHAYPEYQDPSTNAWISIDPTWGHTTGGSEYFDRLDFGHITFVRWGSGSSYPLPAGSYREDRAGKQIDLSIRPTPPSTPEPSYRLIAEAGSTHLVNTGKSALIKQNLEIEGRNIAVTYLPPYGRLPLSDHTLSSPWANYPYLLILLLGGLTGSGLYLFWKYRLKK